ncbi:unnamed protein product [Durusdinium trenchii]|uniref:Intraflagellar transport protein 88-like n=2 Tax=Durusdinium trenchii TaxID=1381693 RepID=A0ABP0P9C1_9DINO
MACCRTLSWQESNMTSSLLASCLADLSRLEKLAMHDASTSQKLVALLRSRSQESEPSEVSESLDMKILSCWDSLGEDFNRQRSEEYLPEERRALFQAAKEAIPLLVRENTVMESNLREYDWALQLTLQELFRVRGDAIELTTLMKQATSIKRYLRAEHQAQQELQEEQMRLEARHEHLTALLHEATNAQDEERTTALIQALAHENSILRSMLFPSKEGEEPFVDSPRRALSSSRGSRSDRRTLSSPSPGSPIEFPFSEVPDIPLPPLPPMPPPSPPSQHRDVR